MIARVAAGSAETCDWKADSDVISWTVAMVVVVFFSLQVRSVSRVCRAGPGMLFELGRAGGQCVEDFRGETFVMGGMV